MSETPQLINLVSVAQTRYPNVPPTMAVVANTDPETLTDSIKQVGADNSALVSYESIANQVYEIAVDRSNEPDTSLSLPKAAQLTLDVKDLRADHRSSVELAEATSTLRHKLSKPMRIAATVLSTLVILGVGDATLHRSPSQDANDTELPAGVILEGIALGFGVGIMVSVNGRDSKLVVYEARRRARKIAKRQTED